MTLTATQQLELHNGFSTLARSARQHGITDQQLTEWLASVGLRWLHAHGVSAANIHTWVECELRRPSPVPMVDAARARNDFGGTRR